MIHFHPLRVSALRRETDDSVVLSFEVPEALRETFRFSPGQYLTLKRGTGPEEARRSYSICAAPGEALRAGVRRVPRGLFSPWVHGVLRVGDTLDVMEPQGRFGAVLAQGHPGHVLLIAGGSGITPILGILRTLLEQGRHTRCTLLYGNRTAASTMFKEELEDLKNRHLTRLALHPVFSREQVDAPLAAGRLDRERITRFLQTLIDPQGIDQAFICGPHAMNDEAQAALRAAGVPDERIHIERFGLPPGAIDGAADSPESEPEHEHEDADYATITLVRDGLTRTLQFDKEADPNILEAAARHGLDVPYSCKSGVCATCRARLIDGEVRMERNFALEQADLDAGFILTCQAHPLTDRVVVSFDHR
ncbi:MAG: phenylacetate-CoA oxygenase/reductase subunit PaaK [Rubrivivax sp.]|nr:phenylacetate-CoA oxygenase/reductase subunit PaaK [Rubrivivax sp.]